MSLLFDSKSLVASAPESEEFYAPRIGAHNVFRLADATVTASAETTGGEKENAYAEGFTFDFWRPGASGVNWIRASFTESQECDYFAVAAHDFHQRGAGIKLQYSTDDGASWGDATTEFLPADSSPIMVLFDPISAGDWRLRVNASGEISLGVLHVGKVLKLNAPLAPPWTPPHLARSNRYVNEVADAGQFVGRSLIAEGARLSLSISGVSMGWLRDQWQETADLIQTRPFFFAARDLPGIVGIAEAEVFYGWTTAQPGASYESTMGALSIQAQGIVT